MKRYFSLYQNKKEADIYIYGDIASYSSEEEGVSSYSLSKELQVLHDVERINVFISSYGGEVKEGIAIYNALKRHRAEIVTYTSDFACSIASVVFTAGDRRVMSETALLMIHNAWMITEGDPNELRKKADDLDKVTQLSINAYMDIVNISEDELKELLNRETWLSAENAYHLGFATEINSENIEQNTQQLKKRIVKQVADPTKSNSKKKKRAKLLSMLSKTFYTK